MPDIIRSWPSFLKSYRSGGVRFVSDNLAFTVESLSSRLHSRQFLEEYDALTDRSFGAGVKLAGYHLQLLGVSPAHQRKGAAKALFKTYTPAQVAAMKGKTGNELRAEFIRLAQILDDYNNGLIGPGHCDE